jgi:hypothetical protein
MCTITRTLLLAAIPVSLTLGQNSPAFRIQSGDALSYVGTVSDRRLQIDAHEVSGGLLSIVPQVKGTSVGADHLAGAVRLNPGVNPIARNGRPPGPDYVGAFGSIFELTDGDRYVIVEYPDSDVVLNLSVSVSDRRVRVKSATYQGGCRDGVSSMAQKYLSQWVTSLQAGVVVLRGQYIELRIPHPSQKAPLGPGERDYTSASCAAVVGGRYYDLTITSVPAQARVYVDGKYIGLTGMLMKVADNPAQVMIRHPKCQELAKSVPLEDGPNNVEVKLGGCKP